MPDDSLIRVFFLAALLLLRMSLPGCLLTIELVTDVIDRRFGLELRNLCTGVATRSATSLINFKGSRCIRVGVLAIRWTNLIDNFV